MADGLSQPKNMQNTVTLKMRMSLTNMTPSEREIIGNFSKYGYGYHIDSEQV